MSSIPQGATLLEVLMRRDCISEEEARCLIIDAAEAAMEYLANDDLDGATNICEEMFGLEPDYLDDVMEHMELII